jgi:hypothetical protein
MDTSKSSLKALLIKGNAKELPIDLHKTFYHMVASDSTMQYMYDNISGAMLRDGSWEINFDEEYFKTLKMKPEYIRTSLKRMWLEEFFNFAENNVNIYSIYSFFTNLAKLNFISDSYRFITL